MDPRLTSRVVGVDLNPGFLEVARRRHAALPGLELVQARFEECGLAPGSFDLVHAALVFEYLEPEALLRKIAGWLSPRGVCCTVLQGPGTGAGLVSPSPYPSLAALGGVMRLVPPEELEAAAARCGLSCRRRWEVPLKHGKRFFAALFGKGAEEHLGASRPES